MPGKAHRPYTLGYCCVVVPSPTGRPDLNPLLEPMELCQRPPGPVILVLENQCIGVSPRALHWPLLCSSQWVKGMVVGTRVLFCCLHKILAPLALSPRES